MKILMALAIAGFMAGVLGQIVSLVILCPPVWGISMVVGIFALAPAALVASMRIGGRTGIWGNDKQWKYITAGMPKWTNKMAIGLFIYELVLFGLMIWKQTSPESPKHEADPFFMICAVAITFYGGMAMGFYAAENTKGDKRAQL